ncbi:glycosyltransferase family 39 protein [Micromonospora sp. NPDC049679]|uniref:glycosyltransferase family 39 protein n=1 Tax=Micromonospora sp. NPDC049679 TaxID=3155920 RepID=UPI0033F77ED4
MAGILVRVARWSNGSSLNSDELWIAVNLQRRSFLGLRSALEYDQLAPLGWLWLEKLMLAIGRSDEVLRLPSLVAGCAVIGLTAVLARRLLPVPLAVAAVFLVAGGPQLIYQSSQLKQYAFEAAACVLLVILALRALDAGRRRPVALFWLTAAVAVWFATTAIFVVASVGGLLALFAALDRRWRLVRTHVLAALPALACVFAVHAMAPSPAAWLYDWWPTNYPASLAPRSLGLRSGLVWSAEVFARFTISALYVNSRIVGACLLLLMALGALTLVARAPRRAALVVAPICAGYVLALLRLYPMATRAALWLVPLALLLVCAGVDGSVQVARNLLTRFRSRTVGGHRLVNGVMVVLPAAAAIVLVAAFLPRLGTPPRGTNADRYAAAEQAVRFIAANRRPGDRVFVHNNKSTSALALWYGPEAGLRPDRDYTTGSGRHCENDMGVARQGTVSRVWLLRVTWVAKKEAVKNPERAAMLQYGRLVGEYWYGGVVVLLYEASPGGKTPASALCLSSRPGPN